MPEKNPVSIDYTVYGADMVAVWYASAAFAVAELRCWLLSAGMATILHKLLG